MGFKSCIGKEKTPANNWVPRITIHPEKNFILIKYILFKLNKRILVSEPTRLFIRFE